MDRSTPPKTAATHEPQDERKPWQPLDFEKIDAAEAEAFPGVGTTDAAIYS